MTFFKMRCKVKVNFEPEVRVPEVGHSGPRSGASLNQWLAGLGRVPEVWHSRPRSKTSRDQRPRSGCPRQGGPFGP